MSNELKRWFRGALPILCTVLCILWIMVLVWFPFHLDRVSYQSTTGTVIVVTQRTFPFPHTSIRLMTFSDDNVVLTVRGMIYFTPYKTYTIITKGNLFELYPRVIGFTEISIDP